MNESRFNSDESRVITKTVERVYRVLTKSEINKRISKRKGIEAQIDKLDSKRDEYQTKINTICRQMDSMLDELEILNKEINQGKVEV